MATDQPYQQLFTDVLRTNGKGLTFLSLAGTSLGTLSELGVFTFTSGAYTSLSVTTLTAATFQTAAANRRVSGSVTGLFGYDNSGVQTYGFTNLTGAGVVNSLTLNGQGLFMAGTIIAPGTVTNPATINKPCGIINIDAAEMNFVINNTLANVNSYAKVGVITVDDTALSATAVCGDGTITITLNAAGTGEVAVYFELTTIV